MTNDIKSSQAQIEEDEIDLIALSKTLWKGRKLIIKTVIVFMILGVAIALLSPKQYTASTTMVPQISDASSKLGGLSSLAAMAGFNLNDMTNSGQLSPLLYPQIVKSVTFQLELMNTTFLFPEQKTPLTYYTYFNEVKKPGVLGLLKKYTIGLPGVIIKALKSDAPTMINTQSTDGYITLTEDQEEIRKLLEEQISLEVNDKDGYLALSATTLDPKLAAQLAQKAQSLLQNAITEFKIEKTKDQLEFITERYNEKKKTFEEAQAALAQFRDRNKNVSSALARTQEEQLQNEYQLAFEVYSQLAQQLEQAQIRVKEDTPVFSVLKPVTVPMKDNTSGLMVLIIWTFLGVLFSFGWILGIDYFEKNKYKWQTENPEGKN